MDIELSGQDARRLRWQSQLLGGSDLTPAGVVRRAVALQGQDLPAVLQAIAIRSRPGTTVQDVRGAFDRGEPAAGRCAARSSPPHRSTWGSCWPSPPDASARWQHGAARSWAWMMQ